MKKGLRIRSLLPAALQFRLALKDHDSLQRRIESTRPPETREAYEAGAIKMFWDEISDVCQSRQTLITENYQRIARNLSVPMPDMRDPELWEEVENSMLQISFRCLTSKGEQAIKNAIREEQKHRRDVVLFYFGIAVGLIGAATGLVSAVNS